MAYTNTWSATIPLGSVNANLADDHIRQTRLDIQDRMQGPADNSVVGVIGDWSNGTEIVVPRYFSHGEQSGTLNLDFRLYNAHRILVHASTALTLTFSNGVVGMVYVVVLEYQGSATVTLPDTTVIEWSNDAAPTLTKVSGKIDVLHFYKDTSRYLAGINLNYSNS